MQKEARTKAGKESLAVTSQGLPVPSTEGYAEKDLNLSGFRHIFVRARRDSRKLLLVTFESFIHAPFTPFLKFK